MPVKQSYGDWLQKVNAALRKKCGLSRHDFADFCYQDAYDNGERPTSVARQVLEAEGWYE